MSQLTRDSVRISYKPLIQTYIVQKHIILIHSRVRDPMQVRVLSQPPYFLGK